MLKQRVQTVLSKLRGIFKRKAVQGRVSSAVLGSTNLAENEPSLRKSVNGTLVRSSSIKSSPEAGAPGARSFEPANRSEDKGSVLARISESPSIPPIMHQLPTIVVGEDLEPISGLGTRKDSQHLVCCPFFLA